MDMERVIKGLEICSEHGSWHGLDCEHNEAYKDCPYRGCETGCIVTIAKDAIVFLKGQEEQIKNRDESLEKAREEIKWLRGMLKEQEATMIIESENMYTGLPITHCPKCDKSLDRYLYGRRQEGEINFCPYCGQAVKWNENT